MEELTEVEERENSKRIGYGLQKEVLLKKKQQDGEYEVTANWERKMGGREYEEDLPELPGYGVQPLQARDVPFHPVPKWNYIEYKVCVREDLDNDI